MQLLHWKRYPKLDKPLPVVIELQTLVQKGQYIHSQSTAGAGKHLSTVYSPLSYPTNAMIL